MRGLIDLADISPCFHCGVDRMRVYDTDGEPHDLDPQPYDGATVRSGWWLRDDTGQPFWAVHMAGYKPGGAVAFLLHICKPSPRKGTPQVTTPNPFGAAAPPGATGPDSGELAGKLLLFTTRTFEKAVPTKYGPADCVKGDLVELESGERHINIALWGKVLVPQFEASPVGTMFVGRIVQGEASGANNPPWLWQNGNEADQAVAMKALEFINSQAVSTQAAAPAATPTPATPLAPPAPAAGNGPPW